MASIINPITMGQSQINGQTSPHYGQKSDFSSGS